MTSVHPWDDPRIFYKEAVSLGKKFDVELYAPARFSTMEKYGVTIFGLPKLNQRFLRPLNWLKLLSLAWKSECRIIHFHDPELIPVGLCLKFFRGKKIIYDVHEDLPASILTKPWIPRFLRAPVSRLVDRLEKWAASRFDAVILAEFSYREKFRSVAGRLEAIVNFPLGDVFRAVDTAPMKQIWRCRAKQQDTRHNLIYAGVLSIPRGAREMILSLAAVRASGMDCRLYLVGAWSPPKLEDEMRELIREHGLGPAVTITGRLSLSQVYALYGKSDIGMALLHPEKNYLRSMATKIYEYMAAGLPVLASDFPDWQSLIEKNDCGITVDPLDIQSISEKIRFLLKKPCFSCRLGNNGYRAARRYYHWAGEERKLWKLYQDLEEQNEDTGHFPYVSQPDE